ncbi:unnamed protein product [marine sediment metagenome]|uniref:Helix-turn-helix domain-containing protein n=1 Tax=marine sediment metagenome TaxID=412755 RepID=X1LJ47_9ZZZZ
MQNITSMQFARAANISRSRVWELIRSKKIKGRKYDGVYQIAIGELQKYKEAQAIHMKQRQEEEEDINLF